MMKTRHAPQLENSSSMTHHAQLSLNRYMNQLPAVGAYRLFSMTAIASSIKPSQPEHDPLQCQNQVAKEPLKRQKGPNPILVQPFKR